MARPLLNLVWLLAIALCVGFGWTNGLLAVLAVFLMDATLEVKQVRAAIVPWIRRDLAALEGEAPPADPPAVNGQYIPTPLDKVFAAICEAEGVAIHVAYTSAGAWGARGQAGPP